MFSVSEAIEGDISHIREIAERTWWPSYSSILSPDQIRYMLDVLYAEETIRRQMVEGSQTYLILRDEEGPQGFASFGRRADAPDVVKLHKLYVLPQLQGKGYGMALIDAVRHRLREAGISVLDLNVNRHNLARAFYEKIGFKILREEDIPIGPYWMNDFVMRMEF